FLLFGVGKSGRDIVGLRRRVKRRLGGAQGRLILLGTLFGRCYSEAGQTQGGVSMAALSLAEHLARVPDPRQNSGKRHSLAALLNLVSVAVLCGMRSLEAIAQFGRSLAPATAKALGFTHPKTPCKSTLSVVLRALPVDALEQELREWAP